MRKLNGSEFLKEAREISKKVVPRFIRDKKTLPISEQFQLSSTIFKCTVFQDGPFTVAVINDDYVGVAKRNPNDKKSNTKTGVGYALSRAVRNYTEQYLNSFF